MNWTLDELKNQLNAQPEIKQWSIRQESVHRQERYFMRGNASVAIDQDREVQEHSTYVQLFVKKDSDEKQGEISQKFFPALPLKEQIQSAMKAAKNTEHEAWSLPAQTPKNLPELKTRDPRLAEDLSGTMNELTQQITSSVSQERSSQFNSAECFVSNHDQELHLSNGFVHRSSQSRIYVETAYSAEKDDLSDEYLAWNWAVGLDDVQIPQLFNEVSERAVWTLNRTKPQSGRYSVLIDAEAMARLFNDCLNQLNSANIYLGLPYRKEGTPFIPDYEGDPLTISLDPFLDFGPCTGAINSQGLPQTPIDLVKDNQVMKLSTDQRYSQYLDKEVTTTLGNVTVQPGKLSYNELTQASPQVLEVLQFSALFTDPNAATFASEIRLARLHNNETGEVTYLRGGSLSGNIFENFKGLRLSRELARKAEFSSFKGNQAGEGYRGPAFGLLSNVSVVG